MIRINQYQLEPSIHSLGWDLKVDHVKVGKDEKKTTVLKDLGYDMPIEYCLRKIIHEEMREKGDIATPTKFLKSFEKLSNEFIEKLKSVNVER